MTDVHPDDIERAMDAAWPWISKADQQYATYRAQMKRGLAAVLPEHDKARDQAHVERLEHWGFGDAADCLLGRYPAEPTETP